MNDEAFLGSLSDVEVKALASVESVIEHIKAQFELGPVQKTFEFYMAAMLMLTAAVPTMMVDAGFPPDIIARKLRELADDLHPETSKPKTALN